MTSRGTKLVHPPRRFEEKNRKKRSQDVAVGQTARLIACSLNSITTTISPQSGLFIRVIYAVVKALLPREDGVEEGTSGRC